MTMMKFLRDKATSQIDWGERTTRVQYLAFFWLEELIHTYIVGICGIAVIIEIAETQKTDRDAE